MLPDSINENPIQRLDLRQTKCPLNFVKAKLALEKLAPNDQLEIWILAESDSAINVPNSLVQEGHTIVSQQSDGDNGLLIRVCRS